MAIGLKKLFKLYDQWNAKHSNTITVIYYSSLVIPTRI